MPLWDGGESIIFFFSRGEGHTIIVFYSIFLCCCCCLFFFFGGGGINYSLCHLHLLIYTFLQVRVTVSSNPYAKAKESLRYMSHTYHKYIERKIPVNSCQDY